MYKKALLILLLTGIAIGCTNTKNIQNTIDIEGRVFELGLRPHAHLYIEDRHSHIRYRILNPEKYNLKEEQYSFFRIKAKIVEKVNPRRWPPNAAIRVLEVKKIKQ